jgi:hypothetical protein
MAVESRGRLWLQACGCGLLEEVGDWAGGWPRVMPGVGDTNSQQGRRKTEGLRMQQVWEEERGFEAGEQREVQSLGPREETPGKDTYHDPWSPDSVQQWPHHLGAEGSDIVKEVTKTGGGLAASGTVTLQGLTQPHLVEFPIQSGEAGQLRFICRGWARGWARG